MLLVYGIPTCGTCKKAIAWLESQAIAHQFINTREQPPDRATLATWIHSLGAKALRNTSGQSYRALPPDRQTWSDDRWLEAFAADPMLLKRPLFVRDGEALAVGFRNPTEIAKAIAP